MTRSAFLLAALLLLPPAPRAAEVRLTWTAPGDDSLTGTATGYDMRYALVPITPDVFLSDAAFPVWNLPAPAAPRTRQFATVDRLLPGTTYYFAIRTVDDAGNWSPISNVVQRTTPVPADTSSWPREVVVEP